MTTRRALLSVSDKTGLVAFAEGLVGAGFEILSTGGTARSLREAGITVTDVSEVTGFPEIMDGRVKTLHPKIHGGLLARRDNSDHLAAMTEQDISGIDLLAVNLYPFEDQLAKTDDFATLVEYIDIGGPAMLRAAAKNHDFVTVVCDPADYEDVLAELAESDVTIGTRRRLAGKVFARTAAYDRAIAGWLAGDEFGETMTLSGRRLQELRYGENPHQRAAVYAGGEARPGVATATQLQGKPLSYNNLNDTDAAFELAVRLRIEPEGDGRAARAVERQHIDVGLAGPGIARDRERERASGAPRTDHRVEASQAEEAHARRIFAAAAFLGPVGLAQR